MAFDDLITVAKQYFPNLQIKYKNQSVLMKILGKILFFNPDFMTDFLTTVGNTIYIPSQQWEEEKGVDAAPVFIHECTHLYDKKRYGLLYLLAYSLPQSLSPISLALIFLISWKIAISLAIFFALPLPAPWRTFFEKRAYFIQMYVGSKFKYVVKSMGERFTNLLKGSDYYFAWPFEDVNSFYQEANNILVGNPSCASEPALRQMVEDLIAAAKK